VELVIDTESGEVAGTIKRFSFQPRADEEEAQIDASLVEFCHALVQRL
jgi:hypothetical protein